MATSEKTDVTRNLEQFTCVWLDQNVNNIEDNQKTEQRLREIINHLYICSDQKQCEDYIGIINREKVVLIVSGTLGQLVIPRIHHLSQLSACYVFCGDKEKHKRWAKNYSKVKGVFVELNTLLENLSKDHGNRSKIEETAFISVINHSHQSLEDRNTSDMWFQLYIEVLLRMHHKLTDRKELFDLCKSICQGNVCELDIIHQFEKDYKSDKSIWWYTRESCLYRMLNKALRFQDYQTLFLFRFFISDIAKQIQMEYDKFIRTSNNRQIICVYRGQTIANQELQLLKNNLGQFLSMNSFFSTSTQRSVAMKFISSLTLDPQMQQRILFEITINPQLQTKPFAHIKSISYYQNEDELLIMLGALFYIEKVEEDQISHVWIARLSLADESDNRLKDTFSHMKEKIGEETDLASLGKIFFEMGEYDQVEKCYQHMMYQAQLDLSVAHSGLGKAALGRQNYSQAAQCEQQALTIKQSILSKHHRDLAVSYSRLGHIYCKEKNHNQALIYLKKAMKIEEKLVPNDPLILAKTYCRIALTCVDLDDYSLALAFYEKALRIKRTHLPPFDKSIASIYHHIGKLYQKQKDFTQALKYYEDAIDIYKKTLPPKHPSIIQIEEDVNHLKRLKYTNQ